MSEMLRGTEEHQRRILLRTGAALTAAVISAAAVLWARPEHRPANTVELTVSMSSVGQGIDTGSNVLLHGVVAGRIISMDRRNGLVDLGIRLDRNSVQGLTDAFGFDFRPQNSFGVTALNLIPHGSGRPLVDGTRIERAAEANASMSELLNGSATVVTGVITDKMVRFIRNWADYTAALAPLLETGFALADQTAQTQADDAATILGRVNSILETMPRTVDGQLESIHVLRNTENNQVLLNNFAPLRDTLDLIATGFFGPIGQLLGKHTKEFTPATEIGRALFDAVSNIIERSRGGPRLDKLLTGLQAAYHGDDATRSLKMKIVLEPFPALESALPPLSDLEGPR